MCNENLTFLPLRTQARLHMHGQDGPTFLTALLSCDVVACSHCPQFVSISGATKGLGFFFLGNPWIVNGVYDLTTELHNGRVLFRKRGRNDLCLRFTKAGNWRVSPVSDKDANNNRGYAKSIGCGQDQHLPPASGWGVWDGKEFAADEGISVTLSDALKSMVRCPIARFRVS
jgi:hypothetical protein